MADIKFLSADGLLYYHQKVKAALNEKVDKETGKVLSSNDYTNTEKTKLAGIEDNADVNLIETITVNNVTQAISGKSVNITVPTNNNVLTNGAGYQTAAEVTAAISSAISGITSFEFQKVSSLPASGVKGTIYLVAHEHDEDDGFDEYIWIDSAFEKLGHTDIDLSGYMLTSNSITNAEIDSIVES